MKVSKKIYLLFLESIEEKFSDYFKHDPHYPVLELAKTQHNMNSFYHLIECCISKISKQQCEFCLNEDKMMTSDKLALNSKNLAIFFNSYYGCPIYLSDAFFSSFKFGVYTDDGMHLFDLNMALFNYFKFKNAFSSHKVYFLGMMHEKEKVKIFEKSVDFVLKSTHFERFAVIGTTGSIIEPLHFYGLFIDKKNKSILIYNSCPKEFKLTAQFNKWFTDYKIYSNSFKNQYETELCGFFASRFLKDVAYSDNPIVEFDKYNEKKNLDNIINQQQREFIVPSDDNKKLVDIFMASWHVSNEIF